MLIRWMSSTTRPAATEEGINKRASVRCRHTLNWPKEFSIVIISLHSINSTQNQRPFGGWMDVWRLVWCPLDRYDRWPLIRWEKEIARHFSGAIGIQLESNWNLINLVTCQKQCKRCHTQSGCLLLAIVRFCHSLRWPKELWIVVWLYLFHCTDPQ